VIHVEKMSREKEKNRNEMKRKEKKERTERRNNWIHNIKRSQN
jgi:hypothetical protein